MASTRRSAPSVGEPPACTAATSVSHSDVMERSMPDARVVGAPAIRSAP
jgi:hypothetical protein